MPNYPGKNKGVVKRTADAYQSRRGQKDDKSFFSNFTSGVVNKMRLDGGDKKGNSLSDIRRQLKGY